MEYNYEIRLTVQLTQPLEYPIRLLTSKHLYNQSHCFAGVFLKILHISTELAEGKKTIYLFFKIFFLQKLSLIFYSLNNYYV